MSPSGITASAGIPISIDATPHRDEHSDPSLPKDRDGDFSSSVDSAAVTTTVISACVPGIGVPLARAFHRVAFTTEDVPANVLRAVDAGSSKPLLWPMVSTDTNGPILSTAGRVSDGIAEYAARDDALVRKHTATDSTRSIGNWGAIAADSYIAKALAAVRSCATTPSLTGAATPGAMALHFASGARIRDDLWDTVPQVGTIKIKHCPWARSWNSTQSIDIWSGSDFIKSNIFQADLGNHDWTLGKVIMWASCLGYGRGATEHVRDAGDQGLSIAFYDANNRAPLLCGLIIRPGADAGGAPDYEDIDITFDGDDNMGGSSAGVTPFDLQARSQRAVWFGGDDDDRVRHVGVIALPILAGVTDVAGNGTPVPPRVPRAAEALLDVQLYLTYIDDVRIGVRGGLGQMINWGPAWIAPINPANPAGPGNARFTADANKWVAAVGVGDIDTVFDRWSPIIGNAIAFLVPPGLKMPFSDSGDPEPEAAINGNQMSVDSINLWRWFASIVRGTGCVNQAIHLAMQLRVSDPGVQHPAHGRDGVLVSPMYCTPSVIVTVPGLSPLVWWGMLQELYLPRFSEQYPLFVTPLSAAEILRALHCVTAMQVDIHRSRTGLSAAQSLVGHSPNPNDLEAISQQRTMMRVYVESINAAFNGSAIKGGSGFALWHPQVANRVMAKYNWAHITTSYADEWPNSPLAGGAALPIGVSPTRIPICFYPYLFDENYPLSRDLDALPDPVFCTGLNPPARAVSEIQYGKGYGNGSPLFMTIGDTDDQPALGACAAWVGRNDLAFWPLTVPNLRGTIFVGDFLGPDIGAGGVASSRRTILSIPSENIRYGAQNPLNVYLARPTHMVETLVEPYFRVLLPARLTPRAQPSTTRQTHIANLFAGFHI